jgi:glycosyltransferase involved in cell wall biosynthesis
MNENKPSIKKVIFIGNYLPRKCGIATFTTDLCESFALKFSDITCDVIPVTDIPEGYVYPDRVRFEITEQDVDSYKQAAEFINTSNTDIVCLQHEYGIFGGQAGSHILALLRSIQAPIVTTFHTILKDPSPRQERVFKEIADLSQIIVVMTMKSVEFLTTRYGISPKKIRIIPHGIPEIAFIDPSYYKDQYAVEGKTVLLTFGLLSPNKGVEFVIRALPEIVKIFPTVVYIILGQTHPNLIRTEGENYRISLQRLATELDVEKHVRFHNRFVSMEDLKEFLVMTDIYITPYLTEQQIVSGTLAYSFGAGNAVISTPFWHAAELLADGRGILVPFKDSNAISEAVIHLLGNDAERNAIRKKAFILGKEMTWPNTVNKYKDAFMEAKISKPVSLKNRKSIEPLELVTRDLPDIKLDHILRMTDSTGILQHAKYSIPNFEEGYCTDDNARALILGMYLQEMEMDSIEIDRLSYIYLAFLAFAFDNKSGRFRNFLNYHREWIEDMGSEDSHGRAIWALGTCIGRSNHIGFQQLAAELFDKAILIVTSFSSPRAWAFSILGIHEYLQHFPDKPAVQAIGENLSSKLHELYRNNCDTDWKWFEQSLTYTNAKLSHALILSGRRMHNGTMFNDGLASLRWLCHIQTDSRNNFKPVGADSFFKRNGIFPIFDQQPIEASATVAACLEAYRATKDSSWYDEAWKAFQWYLGRNILSTSLYDPQTGGGCDALHVDRVNLNQGAESTLAFLLSLAEMTVIRNELQSLKEPI